MTWTKNCRLRCDTCGKFMSFGDPENDQYMPFGNSGDTEEPDIEGMCPACSKEDELYMIEQGFIWANCQPSKADRRAAKVLGFAEAGLRGAAWSQWFKKNEPLPKDWVWWQEPVESLQKRVAK